MQIHRQDNHDIDNHQISPLIMLEFLHSYMEDLVQNDWSLRLRQVDCWNAKLSLQAGPNLDTAGCVSWCVFSQSELICKLDNPWGEI